MSRRRSFDPREPVIAAGTQHDNGWQAWEERPSLDPTTGQPWQFFADAARARAAVPPRHPVGGRSTRPTTGLLVSMHGAGLYNDRYGTFRWPSSISAPPSARWSTSSWPSRRCSSSRLPRGHWGMRPQPRHDRSARLAQLPAAAGLGPLVAAVRLPPGHCWSHCPAPTPGRLDDDPALYAEGRSGVNPGPVPVRCLPRCLPARGAIAP